MNKLTNGELLYVTNGVEQFRNRAHEVVEEVKMYAGEILTHQEVLDTAKDVLVEESKKIGQKELSLDLHEPFSNVWLDQQRNSTGHWEDAR